MLSTVISLSIIFFLLMDPLGNIPLFLSSLKNTPPKRKRFVIFREMVIALVVILFFTFLGNSILALLHISHESILISGGIVLFLIAIRMIFIESKSSETELDREEPIVVPLAIPLVAGPSILASVMVFAHQGVNLFLLSLAIFIAWLPSTLILIGSQVFERFLGRRGLIACEKLMGLILCMIATEMILNGLGRA